MTSYSAGLASRVGEGQDIIDSRDVIARIEELEGERESAINDCDHEDCKAQEAHARDWDADDDGQELAKLKAFASECEGYGDWAHGETLISDHYFETYAQELAEELGLLENCSAWPATCIDWERAARELQQDYMSAELGSTTYWMRA